MPYLMIVDDDEDFASTTATVLRKDGYDVQVELDIDSAVKSMESKPPDLAILDVMFPEDASAGFELARTMRHESGKLKNIPILMLTAINTKFPLGFGSKDIDEDWMPITEFMEKPVDFDVLREKVAKLLGANKANG